MVLRLNIKILLIKIVYYIKYPDYMTKVLQISIIFFLKKINLNF